jgi:hypothetical protein
MSFYADSEQFYAITRALFGRVQAENPQAADDVRKAKLLIRFNCTDPEAELLINGRRQPATVTYGENRVRPEVDVKLATDTLHLILLGDLRLSKALAAKELVVHGPVRKVLAVADLFHQCQAIYPEILREQGLIE